MAKRIAAALTAVICILGLASCGPAKEDTLMLGINAVITETDAEHEAISVRDPGEEGIFNEACTISCAGIPMLYCNYETGEVRTISFEDLKAGDELILGIYSSEIAAVRDGAQSVRVEQLQLGTQRLE